MGESNRFTNQVRRKTEEVTGRAACSWCFKTFPVETLSPRKKGNGHNARICKTCKSNMKPREKIT